MHHIKQTEKGFSLIEVMIAVLVLGVGILAVSKLQSSLIRSGSDANYRSVASSIAQKKIDDLRRFVHLTTVDSDVPDAWVPALSPTSLAFDHIADNQGGLIPSGTYSVSNGITYTLSWTSDNYYYSSTANSAASTTVSDEPAFKLIHVIAKWVGVGDNTNSVVSLDTVIDAYNPSFTDLGTSTLAGGEELIVNYDPLLAPDVVPITLDTDGINKETSKPLPDLSKKGDSTLVTFDTVTYSTSFDTLRREEFRTVACKCSTGNAPNNDAPIIAYTTWDSTEETLTDIATVDPSGRLTITKTNVDTAQDTNNECYICCPQADDLAGDFKVCRLKRVDGILRAFSPWKLVGFNMIPASYFNDSDGLPDMTTTQQASNIALYSNYVTSLIRNILIANGSVSDFDNYSTINTSFVNQTNTFINTINTTTIDHLTFVAGNANNRQIQVRGIYMDYPPSGIYTTEVISPSTTITYSVTNVPLDRVPFYEVNLTQLAGWTPDVSLLRDSGTAGDQIFYTTTSYTDAHDDMEDKGPPCDNTDTVSGRNYITNEEFFHATNGGSPVITTCNDASRGMFYPLISNSTTVSSKIFTNSDGIVDQNINVNNDSIDVSIGVTVTP